MAIRARQGDDAADDGSWVLLLGLALADLFPFGNSELYRAIWDGDEARALELIDSGANPNSTWGATHRIETENRAGRLVPPFRACAGAAASRRRPHRSRSGPQ